MLNQFHNKLLVAASTLACITPLCVATEPYTRVEDHPNGEVVLEMCTRTFVPTDENAPRVHLVSAIHIADKPYYEAMQDLLNSYDTVLFEGVKPAGLDPIDPELDDQAKIEATRERLRLLVQVATMYRAEHGDYPQSMKELTESDDHRIQSLVSSVRLDGWGNTIGTMRETTTSNGVTTMTMGFTSFGADGQRGGEGVNADLSETTEPIDPSAKPKQSPEGIQTQLANALRVSFQLDEMDTTNPNWINADMDVNEAPARPERVRRGLARHSRHARRRVHLRQDRRLHPRLRRTLTAALVHDEADDDGPARLRRDQRPPPAAGRRDASGHRRRA
ncbi:MAG: type II secretion system protein GspG [Phycisphaerales bacterium]